MNDIDLGRVLVVLAATAAWLHAGAVHGAAAAPTAAVAVVDALFAEYDDPQSPGCALGVIRDGEFVYRRGYGMANLEYGIPLTSRSVFRIGSTSKQFTAASIVLLAQSGDLDLEAPVSRHFPEFPGWAGQMTVRHLVLHTSGIRDYLELAFLTGKSDDSDYYTDQWVLDLLARQQATNFAAGEQYLYSNSGYLLLAHIVQRVSGQSLREFAQARIFGPLGMGETHFHDDHRDIVPRRASGYAPDDGGYRISMTTLDLVGDGGVFTTIDDLLAWDRNFYDNRLGGGDAFIERLTTPGRLNDGEALDYAFGLGVDLYRGLRRVAHGGSFVGFRAELVRFPDQRFSAAVLCNRADAPASQLALQVAQHYLVEHLEPAPAPGTADGGEARQAPNLSEEQLREYAGDFWEDREAFWAETRVEDGRLWAVHSPSRRNEMRPVAPDVFEMIGVPAEVFVHFDREDGRISSMRRTIDGKPRGEFRPFERRTPSPRELADYAGRYHSGELDVDYLLRAGEGVLLFTVPGQPEQELTAAFGETFENPDYGAFEFLRAADGAITGFHLQSGRVRNLLFTRR